MAALEDRHVVLMIETQRAKSGLDAANTEIYSLRRDLVAVLGETPITKRLDRIIREYERAQKILETGITGG